MQEPLEENGPPTSFFLLVFLSLFLGTRESFQILPSRLFGNKLKYNESLNNQKKNVLQSEFHKKVIKHQPYKSPSGLDFKNGWS